MSSEKFETAIKKLEAIVEELESGKLNLDDTLKRYEEGVKLSALCSSILNKAEKKIEEIGTGGRAILYLAQGDEKAALNSLEAGVENARDKTIDPSLYSLMNIKLNYNNNPVLEKPEFVALRKQLTGF